MQAAPDMPFELPSFLPLKCYNCTDLASHWCTHHRLAVCNLHRFQLHTQRRCCVSSIVPDFEAYAQPMIELDFHLKEAHKA